MKLSENKPHKNGWMSRMSEWHHEEKRSYVNNKISELSCLPLSLSCASLRTVTFSFLFFFVFCFLHEDGVSLMSGCRTAEHWPPKKKGLLHVLTFIIPQSTQVMSGLGRTANATFPSNIFYCSNYNMPLTTVRMLKTAGFRRDGQACVL